MSTIHFLNVREGDCTWIQHDSNRNTVIDISNGNDVDSIIDDEISDKLDEMLEIEELIEITEATLGNFCQKNYPVNPINYIKKYIQTKSMFRFILTHPDMDHMDGIKRFFEAFRPIYFWDTKNNKQMSEDNNWGQYKKEDWEFYQIKRKTAKFYYAGNYNFFYNRDEFDGKRDCLYILAPTKELVQEANRSGDYNDCSYVIMYKPYGRKIIFAGDSSNKTWDFILSEYEQEVSDIDILLAPHHGRKSGGNEDYLDVLKPKLTIFGNAKSKYLNYNSWNNRGLRFITNNQASNVICEINQIGISVFVSNERFAKKSNKNTKFKEEIQAWHYMDI